LSEHLFSRGVHCEKSHNVEGVAYPKTWPLRTLGEVALVERGKFSHRPRNLPQFFGGPYPFIQVTEIANSLGLLDVGSGTLSEEGVKYSRSFPAGTVLISITGVVLAKTAITDREVWAPDSIVGIQPYPELDARFLEFCLRRLHPIFNATLATVSTTQKNINLETLRPLKVPCPGIDAQLEVVERLESIQQAIISLGERARKAGGLLDTLVSETLFRGC
jgi:type I restriction enzyme S subunit